MVLDDVTLRYGIEIVSKLKFTFVAFDVKPDDMILFVCKAFDA